MLWKLLLPIEKWTCYRYYVKPQSAWSVTTAASGELTMKTYKFIWVPFTQSIVMKWMLLVWVNLYFIKKVQNSFTAINVSLPARCIATYIITSKHSMQHLRDGAKSRKSNRKNEIQIPPKKVSRWSHRHLPFPLSHANLPFLLNSPNLNLLFPPSFRNLLCLQSPRSLLR